MQTVPETPALKRTVRKFADRPTVFVELLGAERTSAGALLASLTTGALSSSERVFIVGPPIGGGSSDGRTRWLSGALPALWTEHERGHYLEGDRPVLRYRRPDGRPLEILHAATYFGDGDYGAHAAEVAWRMLADELGRQFPRGSLLSSPAATGRELLLQSIPAGTEYPVLADELAEIVRRSSGQGRIELLEAPAPGTEIPELVAYDGRWFYSALCRGLGFGPGRLEVVDEYLGQTRARYAATVRIPADWSSWCVCGAPGHDGIGLLGVHEPDGWRYPHGAGETFGGWWDGAELHVAIAHGWDVRPFEALILESSSSGPLDGWIKGLLAVRERLELRAGHHNGPADLAGRALRTVILHTIGALHGGRHRVTRSVPIDSAELVPDDAEELRVEGDRIVWAESSSAGSAWPTMTHPEWSSAIWARARARLLDGPGVTKRDRTGALHVPAEDVIAFRTDAIYLARDPGWPDDGRVGRLRFAGRNVGPHRWPRSSAELLELAAG